MPFGMNDSSVTSPLHVDIGFQRLLDTRGGSPDGYRGWLGLVTVVDCVVRGKSVCVEDPARR